MATEQSDDGALRELALFAGAGGGILGGKLLGWRTVCAVEREAYAAQVLAQRQNDGILEPFPIWSDVCSFDGRPWRGIIDVISGGFPCQDISAAGKGAGITGSRSGLWSEFKRIIREVEPRFVFVENSPMLTSRGLDVVLGDLAEMGFDAEWGCLSAGDVGAPHKRERVWILGANTNQERFSDGGDNWSERHLLHHKNGYATKTESERKRRGFGINAVCEDVANPNETTLTAKTGRWTECVSNDRSEVRIKPPASSWWEAEPNVGRVVDGMAFDVDRLAAIGNGQVPSVAATAFQLLLERLTDNQTKGTK